MIYVENGKSQKIDFCWVFIERVTFSKQKSEIDLNLLEEDATELMLEHALPAAMINCSWRLKFSMHNLI